MTTEIRRATPPKLFRDVDNLQPNAGAFESWARLYGVPKKNPEGLDLLDYYGVSAFSSLRALLRKRPKATFVAELDPSQADGVLVLKTGRDPDHYVLLGDRHDMLDTITNTGPPPKP